MVRIGPSAHSQFPGMENSGESVEKTTVKPGEIQLSQVAKRLNLATEHLTQANPKLSLTSELKVGQEINLPASLKQPVESVEKPGGGATGLTSGAADKGFQAGLLRESLQQSAGIAQHQTRPADPSDMPPAPPELSKGAPLDLGPRPDLQVPPPIHPPQPDPPPPPDEMRSDNLDKVSQQPPFPRPPRDPAPPPPPDDGRISVKDSLPSFTNPAMQGSEGEEEENQAYPSPDGGTGGYRGLPKRPGFHRGIGLPHPPSAGPDGPRPDESGQRSPGDPVNPGPDDPRFSAPIPPTPPGEPDLPGVADAGQAAFSSPTGWEDPSGPDQPRPEASGIGGGGAPPSPPPPDKSEVPPR